MIATDARNDDLKEAIIKTLTERLPNSVRVRKVREILERNVKLNPTPEQIDRALDDLKNENVIKIGNKDNSSKSAAIRRELKRREWVALVDPPEVLIKGEYEVGDTSVVRLLSYDTLGAEDINEITEALNDYIKRIDKTFDERVQKKTAEIYKQMIGIFGVFVSIFSIIIISTDKMLRFSPDVLQQGWWDLLLKSIALFLPVGVVIGGLIWVVLKGIKK